MLDIERRLAAVTGGGLRWRLTFLWMIVACLNVREDGWAPRDGQQNFEGQAFLLSKFWI